MATYRGFDSYMVKVLTLPEMPIENVIEMWNLPLIPSILGVKFRNCGEIRATSMARSPTGATQVRVRCCLLCIYMPAIDRPLEWLQATTATPPRWTTPARPQSAPRPRRSTGSILARSSPRRSHVSLQITRRTGRVSKTDELFVFKTRNFVSKARNSAPKTKNCAFK